MKNSFKFIPYFFYVFAFLSFILPSVYLKVEGKTISYSFLELTFGKDVFELSVGLLLVFILFIATVILSILSLNRNNKLLINTTIILGLASGVLTFFQRVLSNPNSTNYLINVGLILPGIFIIIGTIILFINKVILTKNA